MLKTATEKKGIDDVAVLRYGPKAVGSLHVLRAYFLNEAEPEYDPNRDTDVVDVILGTGFKQLATITEVNQALAALGPLELPGGTCPDTEDTDRARRRRPGHRPRSAGAPSGRESAEPG